MVFKFLSLFFVATMTKVDAIEILANASDALNLLDVLDVIDHYDEPLDLLAGVSKPLALSFLPCRRLPSASCEEPVLMASGCDGRSRQVRMSNSSHCERSETRRYSAQSYPVCDP